MKERFVSAVRGADFGLNKKQIEAIYNIFGESLAAELREAGYVKVNGVGQFYRKILPAGEARNPATGLMVPTVERAKLRFRATKSLKEV